jgi:hypothetical protein
VRLHPRRRDEAGRLDLLVVERSEKAADLGREARPLAGALATVRHPLLPDLLPDPE